MSDPQQIYDKAYMHGLQDGYKEGMEHVLKDYDLKFNVIPVIASSIITGIICWLVL